MKLSGITWDHSRGLPPMVASAQRFGELNPGIEIVWSKRTLQEFADKPVDDLAKEFDLLIIDHPWAGFVAQTGVLVPLDTCLSLEFLEDQSRNSVGCSFESYSWDGHQWAVAVDTATPVASSRPDLLEIADVTLPETFDDLLALAEKSLVAFPAIPIDSLMNFYMFCIAFGEEPFRSTNEVVSKQVGVQALQALRTLAEKVDPVCFEWNPIKTYEAMTQSDNIAYCPFAYGYVNYARRGFAAKQLCFHDVIEMNGAGRFRTTLGGTGLAISARCDHKDTAGKYVEYVASAECQTSLFFESGGQPGHRKAWTDARVNAMCNDFFRATLPALDRSFLRPRYNGYLYFQDNGGFPVQDYMMNGGKEENILEKLNHLYRESLT